jgi:hypothetical protein
MGLRGIHPSLVKEKVMSYQEIPTDAEMKASDDLWGFEVSELFTDPVPHVVGEKRVPLKALPPNDWSIA